MALPMAVLIFPTKYLVCLFNIHVRKSKNILPEGKESQIHFYSNNT